MNNQLIKFFNITGLTWFVPLVKIAAGENPAQQVRQLFLIMGVPIIALLCFWGFGVFPHPKSIPVLARYPGLLQFGMRQVDYWMNIMRKERKKPNIINASKNAIAQKLAENPEAEIKDPPL